MCVCVRYQVCMYVVAVVGEVVVVRREVGVEGAGETGGIYLVVSKKGRGK